jgi:hypothetical protein
MDRTPPSFNKILFSFIQIHSISFAIGKPIMYMSKYYHKNNDCTSLIVSGLLSVRMYLMPTGLLSSLISINTEFPIGMVLTIFLSVSLTYSVLSSESYSTIESMILDLLH